MSLPRVIVVVWVDTKTWVGWKADASELMPEMALAVGFLLSDRDPYLRLAPIISNNGSVFADGVCIPRANVVKKWLVPALFMRMIERWLEK